MKNIVLLLLAAVILTASALAQSPNKKTASEEKTRITFVELGSVNCIPCKQMQPVMKSIEKRYGRQKKVVFHDVWKKDQKQYASKYGIKLIPTQVFLDENGKEIMRHEGFFAEKEIDKFLQSKGLKILN
ncbi:MAG: thioredoxin family protein [Ignavibacteria bacterium]|jgi:thioredoxin 1|nr:thioredoxin family protein [Ignavibacteria bacterium]MCU7503029.1 thioredoxin family protein [Ignavibacteria bacterium]MCU7516551.1 thioredoxin family protein [Ignavibacteria bacterium]